jgi:hypothetical protein
MSSPPPIRVRRKRRRSVWQRYRIWWILSLVAAGAVTAYVIVELNFRPGSTDLAGYIGELSTLQQEYSRFYGRALTSPVAGEQFEQAARLAKTHDYRGAAVLLEQVSETAPLPIVFNDLGVLYERMGDRGRALDAFRDALARDPGYQPVRFSLQRLRDYAIGSAEPATREAEPNGDIGHANVIALGQPVEGAVDAAGDEDYFRFTAPPSPRDMLEVRLENRSKTLAPTLALVGADRRYSGWGKAVGQASFNLTEHVAPDPNTSWFVAVSGAGSTGEYRVTVRPLHAYDSFEPNDDFAVATTLPPGRTVEANILDGRDSDYYSFVSTRTGKMRVELANTSPTLVPAISIYSGDHRFTASAPEVRSAGASLDYAIAVEDGKAYYVQVASRNGTGGGYRLTLK